MGGKGSKGKSSKDTKKILKQTHFSNEEIDQLYAEFKELDADNSGELDPEEFKSLFKSHMQGSTPEQIEAFFKLFDTDGNGTISFQELCIGLSILSKGDAESKLRYLFKAFDKDNSGSLTKDELEALMKQMVSIAVALGRPLKKAESFVEGVVSKFGDEDVDIEKWVKVGLQTPSLVTLIVGN